MGRLSEGGDIPNRYFFHAQRIGDKLGNHVQERNNVSKGTQETGIMNYRRGRELKFEGLMGRNYASIGGPVGKLDRYCKGSR